MCTKFNTLENIEDSDKTRSRRLLTLHTKLAIHRHISNVKNLLGYVISRLTIQAAKHDISKLDEPELSIYTEAFGTNNSPYGTKEYEEERNKLLSGLNIHYHHNAHHPEHHDDGIQGMDLLQLLEMVCDWKAATKRNDQDNIYKSIIINQKRFGFSDELARILENTAVVFDKAIATGEVVLDKEEI